MTKLSAHQSTQTTKMLLLGDPGAGKTGGLASLANAGFKLRVVDLDNGLDVLRNVILDPKSPYDQKCVDNVDFVTLTDPMKQVAGKLIPKSVTRWQRLVTVLDTGKLLGKDNEEIINWGPVVTWGPEHVLVIDSLSRAGDAAMDFVLQMNARLGQKAHQSDWWDAQQHIENLCRTLFDEAVRCNVIINCHVKYIGDDTGMPDKGYPDTPGKALSPKVGSYFNSIVMAKTVGKNHKIMTQSTPLIELKTTNPGRVKAEYPIESGLADYFRDVRGEK